MSSLLAHTGGVGNTGEGGAHKFKEDVQRVRDRLHSINARTINPRSPFIRAWDFVTLSALLFTAFVTPFEVRAPPCSRTATAPTFPSHRPPPRAPTAAPAPARSSPPVLL